MKKKLIFVGIVVIVFITGITIFMQKKVFGKNPSGTRLEKILQSPNYKNGEFQNISPTEVSPKDVSMFTVFKDFFNKSETNEPQKPLPTIQTDLKMLSQNDTNSQANGTANSVINFNTIDKPKIVWFGHSAYFLTYKGINILVDPVFSGNASPVKFFGKAFAGTDIYKPNDFPEIDILIITHDHYDHLDYETVVQLNAKVKKIYTPLGVGSHLEYWGIDANKIVEFDWWDSHQVNQNIALTATPARHFSGRSIQRAKTLWASFVLKLYDYQFFIGGDSGYDTHFKEIGDKFGVFDMVMLESGQYNTSWPQIHMFPEQTVKAAQDLNAKVLFPVHWGKFSLAFHAWDEPIKRIVKSATESNLKITTPMIGEVVVLDSIYPQKKWWEMSEGK
jgi:L-ascorbate metabolism protein UlaG (beta-lactamase superfamily)